jgi:outer membrane lipoprotein-sorting protein
MQLLFKPILFLGLFTSFSGILGARTQPVDTIGDGARFDCRFSMAQAAAPASLERVLNSMDAAAKNFKTMQASVAYDEYQRVINDTDTEKGVIYFRREGADIEMALDFSSPDEKFVRFTGGKVQVYMPKIDQVNEYEPGKNRAEVESFLVLGFGGSGHDLLKSYDVKYVGTETVLGIKTDELELVPKSARIRNDFIASIQIWIDPSRGISIQQKFFQPGGDYRLAKYTDIKIPAKIPDGAFKLKTSKKTKFTSPQG